MKQAFVIICSLLLVALPMSPAQTPTPCVRHVCACCSHGTMPCCAAKSSNSQSGPTTPARANTQNQFSLLAPVLLTLTLPVVPADSNPSNWTPVSTASATPLFARNCALLL